MRRKVQLIASVLATLAGVLYAQTTPEDGGSALRKRRVDIGALDGRDVTVRVYADPENEPTRYELVEVPIEYRSVRFSEVGTVCPSITESAYIVIQAPDQSDNAVARVLGRWVYVSPYTPEQSHSLSVRQHPMNYTSSWTFLDALGDPIVGAKVELLIRPGMKNNGVPIRVNVGATDDKGQLPRFYNYFGNTTVRLEHPNYGVVTIRTLLSEADQAGVYIVPLAPKDVDYSPYAIRGVVVDSDARAIANMPVFLALILGVRDSNDCYCQLFECKVTTDEDGRFTLLVPKVSRDMLLHGLSDADISYLVRIEPPMSSNLRRLSKSVYVGVPNTLILTRMETKETFHTFSFEYHNGPVRNLDELANITLTLERDGRQWRTLTYDQFAGGCTLPPGTLKAKTTRWGRSLEFVSLELNVDSSEHLVFKTVPLTVYRGQVVEFGTNRPLPGVFVLADHSLQHAEPSDLTSEQWQDLAKQVEMSERSDQTLYQYHDRVAITNQDGIFEIVFAPAGDNAFARAMRPALFTALAPGYAAPRLARARPESDPHIMTVPTWELCRPGEVYFPHFIFEDENGPVTDPNHLHQVGLSISGDGWTVSTLLTTFLERREFIAGHYQLRATWDDKYYTYNSVDLTTARPETIIFKPVSIEHLN